jgi:hypothetical protein
MPSDRHRCAPGARHGRRHSAVTHGLEPVDVQRSLGAVTALEVILDGPVVDEPCKRAVAALRGLWLLNMLPRSTTVGFISRQGTMVERATTMIRPVVEKRHPEPDGITVGLPTVPMTFLATHRRHLKFGHHDKVMR